ncbi:hypothetical protein ACQY0O_004964 [Thecaphora frezii]
MSSQGHDHPGDSGFHPDDSPSHFENSLSKERGPGLLSTIRSRSHKKTTLIVGLSLLLLAYVVSTVLICILPNYHKQTNDDGSFIPNANGEQPLNGSRASLLQAGSFYTAVDNSSSFLWSPIEPNLRAYRADTQGVDVVLNSSVAYQPIDGFGSALTDSSAYRLLQLKAAQPGLYQRTMDFLFNNATGAQVLRITMGSSDFSVKRAYSYIDPKNAPSFAEAETLLGDLDTMLSGFSFEGTQTMLYTIPVLKDALERNPDIKVILSPWSPPAFMKTENKLEGGSLRDGFAPAAAEYYVRAAATFAAAGIQPHALGVQNEPWFKTIYPLMSINVTQQTSLVAEVKARLVSRPTLAQVKVLAHDDNWYRWWEVAQIVNAEPSAVDAVGFHCYNGYPSQVASFTAALNASVPVPEVHLTECTGLDMLNPRWTSIDSMLSRVHLPMIEQNARSVIMWNLALDASHGPRLPTSFCTDCVGALQIELDSPPSVGVVNVLAQAYVLTQLAAATRDLTRVGGGVARRIQMTFPGPQPSLGRDESACIKTVAFAAPLNSATLPSPSTQEGAADQRRIGVVVENTCAAEKQLVVSSDGRRTTINAKPGLSTWIWTAP